jgi:hypothetical protein
LFEAARQVPVPLQTDAVVSTPAWQSASPHAFERPGNVHDVALTPSQVAAQALTPAQGWRPPCGSSPATTVVQVPTLGITSQAWHCPVQTVSQQNPSTQ